MNIFMNLVKRSLVEGEIKSGIRAFGEVRALVGASLLLALNSKTRLWPASSSCFPVESARGLTQRLGQVQDPGAIAMEIWL